MNGLRVFKNSPPAKADSYFYGGDCKGNLFFTQSKIFIFFELKKNRYRKKGLYLTRRENLDEIFKDIEDNKKQLINPMLDNIAFLEERMEELKKLPFIQVNPKNPTQQRTTKASRLYKECSQSYMNAIRMLYSMINGHEIEDDPVQKFLEERQKFGG
jgi:hypothetical protein